MASTWRTSRRRNASSIERKLRERMKIPVMHDDQHGTAIIVAAAILNALRVVGKKIGEVKLVTSGAGAAALACLDLLVKVGVKRENITATDVAGRGLQGPQRGDGPLEGSLCPRHQGAHAGRGRSAARTSSWAFSAPNVLKPEMVKRNGRQADHPGARQPGPRDPARSSPRRRGPTRSSPPAGRTTPTRSTTSSAFPTSSAARWMSARPRSTTR